MKKIKKTFRWFVLKNFLIKLIFMTSKTYYQKPPPLFLLQYNSNKTLQKGLKNKQQFKK
jgi:hypothetical protein